MGKSGRQFREKPNFKDKRRGEKRKWIDAAPVLRPQDQKKAA